MLDGVVRFPPEFAARYRAKGYWEDRSLRDIFDDFFAKYADRVAIIDRDAVRDLCATQRTLGRVWR